MSLCISGTTLRLKVCVPDINRSTLVFTCLLLVGAIFFQPFIYKILLIFGFYQFDYEFPEYACTILSFTNLGSSPSSL